jgi:type IV pilus assembly protein PilY1
VHWVNIHKAQVSFSAIDSQRMNATPGKIALLQSAGGSASNGVVGDMLPLYLKSAGLDFPNAQGCSPTGYNAKNALTNCPNGPVSGFIFDAFDVLDLQNLNELNQTAVNSQGQAKFVYQNFWTPHWEGSTFTGCDSNCINTARQTIKQFAASRKVGLLAECGSIAVIEGAQGNKAFDPATITSPGSNIPGWWYPAPKLVGTSYVDPDAGYPATTLLDAGVGIPTERIMTCVESAPDAGTCAASNSGTFAGIRGTVHEIDPAGNIIGSALLKNCTDPNMTAGSDCIYYAQPGSAYSQIGDYNWFSRLGIVSNYKPNAGNVYGPNTVPLGFTIHGVTSPGPLLGYTQARPQMMADNIDSMIQPPPSGDKSSAAQIIYLGGHTYASDVSGTRVVLNTMLALGTVPTSTETGFSGATDYNDNAFVATYDRVTSQGAQVQWQVFAPATGDQWQFPYHHGHLRAHPIYGTSGLAVNSANKYTDAVAYNGADAANALPSAVARNIFTYLGGVVTANPALGAGQSAPNKVLQTGWAPVDVDYPSVDPSSPTCVDKLHIGEINSTSKPKYSGLPYAGMLPGQDGVCDLQEAFELTKINLGADHGTVEGAPGGPIPTSFLADVTNAKEFTQLVRGFCYATDASGNFIARPTPAQCNALAHGFSNIQNDAPELGGFVRSQPAVVPASMFIADAPTGKHRPTVAYVGGLDGMLHAFYVPSDANDIGYLGPAAPITNFNSDASNAFKGHTPYNGSFAPPAAMAELWAFIPPGQLPLLASNNAVVDSSPVVIDVFGDFDGSGIRSWHTVLVCSAGGTNRELFALDVTNPLKPILLWDLQSTFEDQAPYNLQYAPSALADDDTGLNKSTQAQAFSWQNGCHDGAVGCTPTDFQLPPTGNPPVTGIYNYLDLGASASLSVAQLRRNNVPLFASFVATNEPQNKADSGSGIYVFSVDAVTGQKVWEFNNPYKLSDDPANQLAGIGNTPPAGATLFSKTGNGLIDTLYVGDDEGALWELDAADGLNVNSYAAFLGTSACAAGQNCNFALSQAYGDGTHKAQPISTLSTIFILPPTYPVTGPLAAFAGQALLTYGTGGTDTISGLEPAPDPSTGNPCPTPCINGALHILPLGPMARYSPNQVMGPPPLINTVQSFGVVKGEVTGYPSYLTNGERLYGSIVVAGDQLFFNTTSGTVSAIDSRGNLSGSSYRLNLESQTNPLYNYVVAAGLSNVGGAGGTPLVDAKTGAVVVVTDKTILRFDPPAGATAIPPTGPSVNGRGQTPTGFLSWFFRRRGLEY